MYCGCRERERLGLLVLVDLCLGSVSKAETCDRFERHAMVVGLHVLRCSVKLSSPD